MVVPSRHLKDRIRELGAKVVAAREEEVKKKKLSLSSPNLNPRFANITRA
jgi:hypothetical protein